MCACCHRDACAFSEDGWHAMPKRVWWSDKPIGTYANRGSGSSVAVACESMASCWGNQASLVSPAEVSRYRGGPLDWRFVVRGGSATVSYCFFSSTFSIDNVRMEFLPPHLVLLPARHSTVKYPYATSLAEPCCKFAIVSIFTLRGLPILLIVRFCLAKRRKAKTDVR